MKKEVILIFDIGKTNKKVLLFDKNLQVVYENEQKFPETTDGDGFACDNIDLIEQWINDTVNAFLGNDDYDVKAINFSTYGATLAYLDSNGHRIGPIYNYLKPMPEGITDRIYNQYGGVEEFSRRTASPALGMLNSGMQIEWLRQKKNDFFKKVHTILHFPQYLCYYLTKQITSEYTSIGCHTAMWDFDNMQYHPWIADKQIPLPKPLSNDTVYETAINEIPVKVGVGIHDSSASLVPYLKQNDEEFILVSTGTWCITMNPFNYNPLTQEQLEKDCLSNLSIHQKPVKSSRFFLGHIHDVNTNYLMNHYNVSSDAYKKVKYDLSQLETFMKDPVQNRQFFKDGMSEDYVDKSVDLSVFKNFDEAYHQLMFDLTMICIESMQIILPSDNNVQKIYITGGFVKNDIFIKQIASHFSDKQVYTSEIGNSSALGAALVVYSNFNNKSVPSDMLGAKLCPSL